MKKQIYALKLALDVMRNQGDVGVDEWIATENAIKEALAQQSNEQGCEHCNHSLYCGTKCKNCGKQSNEQVEPVAYGMWDSMIGCGGRMMYVRLDKGQDGCTVPLYTIPPQRKLLTDEQWMIEMVDAAMVATRDIVPRITRSQCRLIIEAAHGIKG